MKTIREPKGVDFFVVNQSLSETEREIISNIVTNYRLSKKKYTSVSCQKSIQDKESFSS